MFIDSTDVQFDDLGGLNHMTQSNDDLHKDDVSRLHKMGYAQELSRSMGHFSNFSI